MPETTIEKLANEPTCVANRRTAAEVLLAELESSDTPSDRKLEIVISLARINPGAYEHVAKIQLRGLINPVNERPESKRGG